MWETLGATLEESLVPNPGRPMGSGQGSNKDVKTLIYRASIRWTTERLSLHHGTSEQACELMLYAHCLPYLSMLRQASYLMARNKNPPLGRVPR